ncbi:unnamed protein product, partial [Heligmosomoides polygyrus]|uniref:Small integral membrane protein 4 n=1 Tax=Heligmosomoides polygyrus TaxID=6339 RepID=A0A183F764_HELPZ
THSQDLSESGVCLTGCKQPEIERSGRVVVPAEKISSRQKDHQSIKVKRMSYPHAVRRMKQHRFFSEGWARALPIVAANIIILLVGTLVFLRLVGYYNREYRRRRFSLEGSLSLATN